MKTEEMLSGLAICKSEFVNNMQEVEERLGYMRSQFAVIEYLTHQIDIELSGRLSEEKEREADKRGERTSNETPPKV